MAVSFYNPGLTFHQSTTCDGRLIYRVCCFDRRKYGILTDSSRTLSPILHECLPQFMRKCVLTNTELPVSRTEILFNLLRISPDSNFLESAVLKDFYANNSVIMSMISLIWVEPIDCLWLMPCAFCLSILLLVSRLARSHTPCQEPPDVSVNL